MPARPGSHAGRRGLEVLNRCKRVAYESVEQGGVVPDRSRLEKAVSPEHTFEPHEVGTRKSRALEQGVVAEDLSRSAQRENPAGGLPFSSEHAHAVRHRADEREVVAREKDAPPARPKGFQNVPSTVSPVTGARKES